MSTEPDDLRLDRLTCRLACETQEGPDLAVPGLVYAAVKDEFPDRGARRVLGASTSRALSLRALFGRRDDAAFIEVGPNHVALVDENPGRTWAGVSASIQRLAGAYAHEVGADEIRWVRLQLDGTVWLPVPEDQGEEFVPSDYFNLAPKVGGDLCDDYGLFDVSLSYVHKDKGLLSELRIWIDPDIVEEPLDEDSTVELPVRVMVETRLARDATVALSALGDRLDQMAQVGATLLMTALTDTGRSFLQARGKS